MSACYCSSGSCFDSCSDCPSGYYNSQNSYCGSVNSCKNYKDTEAANCEACDAGKYNPLQGEYYSTSCITCEHPESSLEGSGTCNKCKRGYGKNGGTTCSKCPIAKYQDQDTLSECKTCPDGKTTIEGSNDATGKTSIDNCVGCALGSVVTGAAPNLVCTTCSSGKYRDVYSSVVGDACVDCIPGRFIEDDGNQEVNHVSSSDCTTCPKGYQYASPAGCSICEGGTYQDQVGIVAVACQACAANTFLADDKGEGVAHDQSSDCMLCPSGKFSAPAQRYCEACQAGQVKIGATCQQCVAGRYSTGNENACVECNIGTVQKNIGTTFCTPCLPGTYQNVQSQAECKTCPLGWYQNASRGAHCMECPLGYIGKFLYCEACQAGQMKVGTACQKCESGRFTTGDENECVKCNIGTVQKNIGTTFCTPCLPGTYQNVQSQAECKTCPFGWYQADSRGALCVECPQGFLGIDSKTRCDACPVGRAGDSCDICLAGTYRGGNNDAATCLQCPTGWSQDVKESSGCYRCVAGAYNPTLGSVSCKLCPVGYHQKGSSAELCVECIVGRYSEQQGQADCIDCVPGRSQSMTGTTSCEECTENTFANISGSAFCLSCPPKKPLSSPASSQCRFCPSAKEASGSGCNDCSKGKFVPTDNGASCGDCPAGYHQSDSGQASCLPCIPSQFQNEEGQASCKKCAINTYMPNSSAQLCITCSSGRTAILGSVACTSCVAGTFIVTTGTHSEEQYRCDMCAPGKFSQAAQMSCTLCAKGFFQIASGMNACNPCPSGKWSDQKGATSMDLFCKNCQAGFYSRNTGAPSSNSCTKCSSGKASDTSGASSSTFCIECVPGKSSSTGSSQCSECAIGKYQANSNQATCLSCIPGQSQNNVGQIQCKQCQAGTYTNVALSTSCVTCDPGETSLLGSARCEGCTAGFAGDGCVHCLPGWYRSGTMSSASCAMCPKGWHQPAYEGAGCLPCNLGKSQALEGQSVCNLCSINYYANRSQMSECTSCESGKTQPIAGSASCLSCSAGEYGETCAQCAIGQYRRGNALDASSCRACLPGFYQNMNGSSACLPCIPGRVAPGRGSQQCDECPAGKMQTEIEGTTCIEAPSGTIVNEGGSSTYEIAKGWHATKCDPTTNICTDSAPCDSGTIGENPATSNCLSCPAGWTSYRGSLDCVACEPGRYAASKGAQDCKLCGEFQHQPHSARETCLACGHFERGDSARLKCVEAREPTPAMPPPDRPVATTANVNGKNQVTFAWGSVGNEKDDDAPYAPKEIVVEWCANDLFKEDETNMTVVPADVHHITLHSLTSLPPTISGILVRLSARNTNYRSKSYSPISDMWTISSDCHGSYLDDIDQTSPWSWNCSTCPHGAACSGAQVTRTVITARAGFWRLSDDPIDSDFVRFYPCLVPIACLGVVSESSSSSIVVAGDEGQRRRQLLEEATGMQGERCNEDMGFRQWCNRSVDGVGERCRLCGACKQKYQHMFGRNDCAPCPGSGDTATQYILLFFTLCVFVFLFTLLVFCRAKGRGRKSVSSGIRKIIINFLQVTSLCVAWAVPWPTSITWMLVVEGFSSSISDATISLSCSMPSATAFQVMQASQIMWSCTPFLMIMGMTIVYGSASVLCCPTRCGNGTTRSKEMTTCELWRKRRRSFQSPKDNWVMACLYTLYLMYPALAASSFSLLRCVDIDGMLYLRGDLQVECYSWKGEGHMYWIMGLSLPCLIVFVIGIPVGGLATLWSHRDSLYDRNHPKHRWAMVRYGLLYDGYKEESWWFEVVVATRKVGFVAMAMLTEGRMQVQIAVGFLALMLALNICIQPYGLGTGAHTIASTTSVNSTETILSTEKSRADLIQNETAVALRTSDGGGKPSGRTSSPNRLSVLRGNSGMLKSESNSSRRDSMVSRSSTMTGRSRYDTHRSRRGSAANFANETHEERQERLKIEKYDHRILQQMDLVSLLTSLVLAWSGMLFILAEDERIRTNPTTKTKHSTSEEILGFVIVLLNMVLFSWAGYGFVTRWINEHDRHMKFIVKQAKRLGGRVSTPTLNFTNKLFDRKSKLGLNVPTATPISINASESENAANEVGSISEELYWNASKGDGISSSDVEQGDCGTLSNDVREGDGDGDEDEDGDVEMTTTMTKNPMSSLKKRRKHQRERSLELLKIKTLDTVLKKEWKEASNRINGTVQTTKTKKLFETTTTSSSSVVQKMKDKKQRQREKRQQNKMQHDKTVHSKLAGMKTQRKKHLKDTYNQMQEEVESKNPLSAQTLGGYKLEMTELYGNMAMEKIHRDPETLCLYMFDPQSQTSKWLVEMESGVKMEGATENKDKLFVAFDKASQKYMKFHPKTGQMWWLPDTFDGKKLSQ